MSQGQDVDIKHLRKRATSGARWTSISTGVRIVTQFVQLAILARLLKVEDFGLMAMVNVVLAFALAFGDAGVSNAIIHYRDAKRDELSSLYWLNVFSGLVVFVVTYLVAPLAARVYHQPPLVALLRVAAVVFILGPMGQQFQVLFERDLRFKRLAAIEIASVVVGSTVGIALAAMGNGVWSLVWVTILQTGIQSIVLAVIGWSTWRPMLHFAPQECRRFLRFGLFQMGERTLNLAGQQIDKLVIGIVMGPKPLGYYDLAYRLIARPYQTLNPVFTRVAFPVFSAVQKDRDRLRKGYLELIEAVGALSVPLYFGMFALAAPFVRFQLGPGYETTVELLRILCLVGLSYSLTSPAGSLILACGRAEIGFYLNALRAALVVVAIWIGARWGVHGIAWGLVAVVAGVMFHVQTLVRNRLTGMTFREYARSLAPYFGAAAVAAAICIGARRVVPWPSALVELAVMLPLCGAIYLGLLAWRSRSRLDRMLTLVRS